MRTIADRYFSLKTAVDGGGVVLFPNPGGAETIPTQCRLIAASSGVVTGTFSGSSFTELTIRATKPGVVAIQFYSVGKNLKTSGWESAVLPVTLKNDKAFVEPDTTWVPKADRVGGIDNATSIWVKIGDVVYSSTEGVLPKRTLRVPDANLLLSFLNGDEGVTEETVAAAAEEQKEAVAVCDQLLSARTVLASLAVALKVERPDGMDDAAFHAALQAAAATHSGILHEANWRANLMKTWGAQLDVLQPLLQSIADALGLTPGSVRSDAAGVEQVTGLLFPLIAEHGALLHQICLLREIVESPISPDPVTTLDLAKRSAEAMKGELKTLRGHLATARQMLLDGLAKASMKLTGWGSNAVAAETARHLAKLNIFQPEDKH